MKSFVRAERCSITFQNSFFFFFLEIDVYDDVGSRPMPEIKESHCFMSFVWYILSSFPDRSSRR